MRFHFRVYLVSWCPSSITSFFDLQRSWYIWIAICHTHVRHVGMQACREIPTRFVCTFAWFIHSFSFFACLVISDCIFLSFGILFVCLSMLCLLFAHFCFDRAPSLTACLLLELKNSPQNPPNMGTQSLHTVLCTTSCKQLLSFYTNWICVFCLTCAWTCHASYL